MERSLPLLHIIVLAVVQGITEFLPISSSGHLILVPMLTDWPDQGLAIDVAVHVGTLGAVMLYFWRDVWTMITGFIRLLGGRGGPGAKLALHLIVATIPVVIAGGALKYFGLTEALRSVAVIGWTMLGFGIVLYAADRYGMTVRRIEHMAMPGALAIGLAQVLALIPGTSRAGITITAARMAGYERAEAARFSMLLSIPTIAAAGTLSGLEIYESGNNVLGFDAILAAGLSFGSALVAIALLMRWLQHASFTPFVLYRVGLGLYLLYLAYA
jgi:undecaprenyl-diphosphatase